jgi:hypothetical protein
MAAMPSRTWLAGPLLCALAACGASRGAAFDSGRPPADASSGVDTTPASDASDTTNGSDAAPVVSPAGQWTWVDVPGSACDDGSPTGFAINPGSGDDLVIYFEGGGACWDYGTCYVINAAVHGPVGRAQWNTRAGQINVGPFDRTRATNAFRASSYAYIPYCTGDLHGGTNVQSYTALADTRQFHHVGRLNAQLYLERIRATWPSATRVVVSGTSAGGFGATLNYDMIRRAFPYAKMALVDDAGPLLAKEGIPSSLRSAWFTNWHLGDTVNAVCPTCRDDLSSMYTVLSQKYPADRLALVSALQDPVISAYFALSLAQFEASLRSTVKDRFDPTANARAYLVAGAQHGFVAMTTTTVVAGVSLEKWLDALVNGDPTWATVSP